MSDSATLVTEEHVRYVEAHTRCEDDFLRLLKKEAAAAGIPSIWISPSQAAFMQIVLRAARAQRVVEVGTLAGYSAIAMARALPENGKVVTIELNPSHATFAERWIARSDVAKKIELMRGAGVDCLPKIETGSADVCFLDADKANYPNYLRECLRILKRGGLMMADNAFAFGELFAEAPDRDDVLAMRKFNDLLAQEPALQSIIVPLGDGLWLGVRR
jgi:predicted O-methyltransferase YrrM